MSVTGRVINGVVVLPPGMFLEGAEVKVESLVLTPADDPLLAAAEKAARPRPDWPADYVLNHGHYVSGEPRKS